MTLNAYLNQINERIKEEKREGEGERQKDELNITEILDETIFVCKCQVTIHLSFCYRTECP